MKTKSFFEVLEKQIRADLTQELRAEIQAELRHSPRPGTQASAVNATGATHFAESFHAEYLQVWLATHSRYQKRSTPKQSPYGQRVATPFEKEVREEVEVELERDIKQKPKPPHQMSKVTLSSSEEAAALALLNRYGAGLTLPFSNLDLRRAWRKAANQTHPDRFVGAAPELQVQMTSAFCAVTDAAELLEESFKVAA
jgi:hypothetical protein